MPFDWVNCCNVVRDAFRVGMRDWVDNAMVEGGLVMAPACILQPGTLKGSMPFEWRIQQAVMGLPELPSPSIGVEFGKALQRAVDEWACGYTATWGTAFPSLVMFPGAFAPPMPATGVMMLSMGASAGTVGMTSALLHIQLQSGMTRLGGGAAGIDAALRGLTDWIDRAFRTWLSVAFLRGDRVMGSGPVPTFLPPQVVGGPVMNGRIQGLGVLGGPPFGM